MATAVIAIPPVRARPPARRFSLDARPAAPPLLPLLLLAAGGTPVEEDAPEATLFLCERRKLDAPTQIPVSGPLAPRLGLLSPILTMEDCWNLTFLCCRTRLRCRE